MRTIIKREFLDNILSFKFIACVLVAIVLVVFSTFFLAGDYRNRLEDSHRGEANAQEYLRKIPVYSYLEVGIYKKPSPLSIFISGIERETGNSVTVTHREIPTELKGGLIKNEFSQIFSFFDLSSVIVIVFTVLAMLLSYNSISGEKEEGMLSLVLSNSVPRFKLLLAKYLGGLLSIVFPLTICFSIASLIVLFSKGVSLSKGFWPAVFLFYLLTVLYLSSVLLIGIFVSTRTKAAFNSLLILLAFYVITIFLLPVSIADFARKAELKKATNYENNAANLSREVQDKTAASVQKIPVKRDWASMERRGERFILKRMNPEATIEYYKQFHEIRERIMIDYARKAYDLKQKDFQIADRIYGIKNLLLMFLPSAGFEKASELAAGTGRKNASRFFEQVFTYWQQYVRYLEDKNAFSLRYFYPYSDSLSPAEKAFLNSLSAADAKERLSLLQSERKKFNQKEYDFLNLNDMPVLTYYEPHFGERIKGILPNVLVLFFYSLLFFLLAHFSFARYDPRMKF